MTNKPMLSVELELLELVTDNKHIDKESICIRRWEALCKLRAILNKPAGQHQGEPVACMPVDRCYDVRAKMIIAFNEAKKAGGDMDDALDAAYKSALRYSPNPMTSERPAPVAFPGYPPVPEDRKLPAPVAVVMPERKRTHPSNPLHAEAMQYNAALDDVTRLNGVKP